MLEQMVKVRVYGSKGLLNEFFVLLRNTALLHLCEVSRRAMELLDESEVFTACEVDGVTHTRREKIRSELRLIEEVSLILEVDLEGLVGEVPDSIGWEDLNRDIEVMRELSRKYDELTEELGLAKRYRRLCRVFTPILRDIGDIKRVKAMGVTIDSSYRDQVLPALRERMEEITGGGYQMLWRTLDEETVGIVILFPPSYAEAVSDLLADKNIHEMHLPRSYGEMPFLKALTVIEKRLEEIPANQAEIDERRKEFGAHYGDYLIYRRRSLMDDLEDAEVVSKMACTRFLFVCEGYLPERNLSSFKRDIADKFGDDTKVVEMEIYPDEINDVPVSFSNPFFFKPFERLLGFLPLPRYGTIDPTPILALTFPLFFGIILGDIGYGLITLFIAGVIHCFYRKTSLGKDIALLLGVVSVSSILFGFIFGELFGDLGHRIGLEPLWHGRLEAVAALLLFTIAIGVGHVFLSFLMATLQNLRNKAYRGVGVMLLSIGSLTAIFLLLGILSGYLPRGGWMGVIVILIVCITLLIYLGGLVAALEVITAIGNVLSYSRLMALGVASAALAVVANKLGGATGNIVAAVIVVILLHGINLVLGVFGPTIHGLRLHFVEFLPRYYKYGGKAYAPFGKGRSDG